MASQTSASAPAPRTEREPARSREPDALRAGEGRTTWLLLAAFVAAWTLYALIAHGNLDAGDMAEAYMWSRSPELGYHKHPPLSAWIVAGWFTLFPESDWAYCLLASVNVAVAIYFSARLARLLVGVGWQAAAAAALMLLPSYTFLSLAYNANSAALPFWSAGIYFFAVALRSGRLAPSILAGICVASATLVKYYAVVLALSLLLTSLVGPWRGRFYRSAAPYAMAAAGLVWFLPHLVWLIGHDFAPVRYAAGHTGVNLLGLVRRLGNFTGGQVAYLAPALAVFAVANWRGRAQGQRMGPVGASLGDDRLLIWLLALSPFAVTVLLSVAVNLDVDSRFGITIWPAFPPLLLAFTDPGRIGQVRTALVRAALVLMAAVVVLAPVVRIVLHASGKQIGIAPRAELAREVERLWREETGRPLRIVAGSEGFGYSLSFYHPDHPMGLANNVLAYTPWVTPAGIERDGILVACVRGDAPCAELARALGAGEPRPIEVTRSPPVSWGLKPNTVAFDVYIRRPQG